MMTADNIKKVVPHDRQECQPIQHLQEIGGSVVT
jgi:hypothetical protein